MLQYQFLTLQRLWSVSSSRNQPLAVVEQDKMLFDERQLDLLKSESGVGGKHANANMGKLRGVLLLHKAQPGFVWLEILGCLLEQDV